MLIRQPVISGRQANVLAAAADRDREVLLVDDDVHRVALLVDDDRLHVRRRQRADHELRRVFRPEDDVDRARRRARW